MSDSWNHLLRYWREIQPLIAEGYRILDKEVTMGLPGPSMPAISLHQDSGIGSPYGLGAKRVWDFFGSALHKIQLGPGGKTNRKTGHSPYMSSMAPNPFFIPLESLVDLGLVSDSALNKIYTESKVDTYIDFPKVEKNYTAILKCAYRTAKTSVPIQQFQSNLAQQFLIQNQRLYIGDLQVQLPSEKVKSAPHLFLSDFTLGAPPDMFSTEPQSWGFPVLNPRYLWDKNHRLGRGGRLWQEVIRSALLGAKGGLRIDHYIGFVNPYVIAKRKKDASGRLYSSQNHPVLGQYALSDIDSFYRITEKILLPVLHRAGLTNNDLYLEDIGARFVELDQVLSHFGLGRLLVAQFREPWNPNHIYQLNQAKPQDVAVLDTHDTPSIQSFFDGLDDAGRYQHATTLAQHLRFHYNDSLKSTEALTRMQWGELMMSPAKRVQAFFTSWTGQMGRYNIPESLDSWHLRCAIDFEQLYFRNLLLGRAYNPLDAIALAIYAKGDAFYGRYTDFVHRLRVAEDKLKELISIWQN